MCKILVQNFIIKDILKKKNVVSLNFCTDYSLPINTSFYIRKKSMKRLPENSKYAEMLHSSDIGAKLYIFYLSHGLVQVM